MTRRAEASIAWNAALTREFEKEPENQNVHREVLLGKNKIALDAVVRRGVVNEFTITCLGALDGFSFSETRIPDRSQPLKWSSKPNQNPLLSALELDVTEDMPTLGMLFLVNTNLFGGVRNWTRIDDPKMPLNYELHVSDADVKATLFAKLKLFLSAFGSALNPSELGRIYREINPFENKNANARENAIKQLERIPDWDIHASKCLAEVLTDKVIQRKIKTRSLKSIKLADDKDQLAKSEVLGDLPRRIIAVGVQVVADKLNMHASELSKVGQNIFSLSTHLEKHLEIKASICYLQAIGIAFGAASCVGHGVQLLTKNPELGLTASVGIDYTVQTAAFWLLWKYENSRFYSVDANKKELRKLLLADFAVSALIYASTTSTVLLAGKAVSAWMPSLEAGYNENITTFLCLGNFALFGVFALKNMVWWAGRTTSKYLNYLIESQERDKELRPRKHHQVVDNVALGLAGCLFLSKMVSLAGLSHPAAYILIAAGSAYYAWRRFDKQK